MTKGGLMIDIKNYPIFATNILSLQKISCYTNDNQPPKPMICSKINAVSFDKVKDEHIKGLHLSDIPKSNDALCKDKGGSVVFVEFKNGSIDKKVQHDIRRKIYDSVLIFTDITESRITEMRKNVDYILVINEDKNSQTIKEKNTHVQESDSYTSLATAVSKEANEKLIRYGLKMFKNYCFKEVSVLSKSEFEEYAKSHLENFC